MQHGGRSANATQQVQFSPEDTTIDAPISHYDAKPYIATIRLIQRETERSHQPQIARCSRQSGRRRAYHVMRRPTVKAWFVGPKR
jgi:hypothetical protein